MSWVTLADDATVRWDEFREGVSAGDMAWLSGDPGSGAYANDKVMRRAEYELLVRTTGAAWPDHLSADACLTKQTMIDHADTSPPVPQNFAATHNHSVCPSIRVDITTTSAGQKVLERSTNDGASWTVLSGNWTTLSFQDLGAPAGHANVRYRARFIDRVDYAFAATATICIM